MIRPTILALAGLAPLAAQAAPIDVLFVGNSYTFGRYDPVMSYNAENVTDLTSPKRGGGFEDTTGANEFEPHPWSGVAGIFKRLTDQAGLDYNVFLSTRNAASLRGHFLNTSPADWDMRGNMALQTWDKVVLQEQSDEVLPRQTNASGEELNSNPEYTRYFADTIEDFLHSTDATGTIRYRDAFDGATADERQAACEAAGISVVTCGRDRGSYANPNGDPDTEVYLYQTWARPNMIDGAFVTSTDEVTGEVTRSDELSTTTFYPTLEDMTADLVAGYRSVFDLAADDGTPGFAGIAPVGEAFLLAVQSGLATRDMWADGAATDGLLDLWFDDGTHASTYGSYLSALVLFGTLTGEDPSRFGAAEIAAADLGIGADSTLLLQGIAAEQLGFPDPAPVPLPASLPLLALGAALLGLAGRRRR